MEKENALNTFALLEDDGSHQDEKDDQSYSDHNEDIQMYSVGAYE